MISKDRVFKILKYVLFAAVFGMLGFMQEYYIPRLKTWMLTTIRIYSRQNLPVNLDPEDVSFSFWPVGLRIDQIQITPRGTLAKNLKPAKIKEVRAGISFLGLVMGNLRISDLIIVKPEINYTITSKPTSNDKNEIEIPLTKIYRIPIDRVLLKDAVIHVAQPQDDSELQIEQLELQIKNRRNSLLLQVQTPHLNVLKNNKGSPFHFESRIFVETSGVQISAIKAQKANSFVIATGSLDGDTSHLEFNKKLIKLRANLDIKETLAWVHLLAPQAKLPDARGKLETDIILEAHGPTPDFKITTKIDDAHINQFVIGDVSATASGNSRKVQVQDLVIHNSAGSIKLSDTLLKLEEPKSISTKITARNLQVQKLLENLGVGKVPVILDMSGELPCAGELSPLQIHCAGHLDGNKFRVYNHEKPDKSIVAVPEMHLDGEVDIDSTSVRPKAKLKFTNTEGEASGVVDYKNGFQFQFSSPKMFFSDLASLADLKFEGTTEISGTTEGDSEHGVINMNLNTSGFWFENYGVGSAQAAVNYKSGILSVNDIKGRYNNSRYKGNVAVNLSQSTVQANLDATYIEGQDVREMFSRVAPLPFTVLGTGWAKAKVSGPLEFTKLTYTLETELNRALIANESIDQAHFNVVAKEGFVTAQKVDIKKGSGYARLEGIGKPDGNIETQITGKNFLLEDFLTLSRNGSKVQGVLNFQMAMSEYVLKPRTKLTASVTQTKIGSETVQDSNFELTFTPKTIEGKGSLFGDHISGEFVLPVKDDAPFSVKGKTTQWNFSPLIYLYSPTLARDSYFGEITSEFDVKSATGGFWNSSGAISISQLYLRRGDIKLFAPDKILLTMNAGKLNTDNFVLQGPDSHLKADSKNTTNKNLNININTKMNLSILSFLTPFFQDFRGKLSFTSQIRGSLEKAELLGSAYIEDGYIRIKELPHAFEKIKADALFNQNKILINHMETSWANGTLLGAGTVLLKGSNNFPVAIQGTFENVNLQIPEGVNTQGNGNYSITGNWFPYLLSGNYNIQNGLINRNFQDSKVLTTKKSELLPKMIKQQSGDDVLRLDMLCSITGQMQFKSPFVDTPINGQVQIKGTNSQPSMIGAVKALPGGKVFFRDTPFDINTAEVKFANPNEIEPDIYATAMTRVKTYDINLLFQGKLQNYNLNLTSVPPLSEPDIVSLLALGITSGKLDQQSSEEQSNLQTYQIGSAILSDNPIGKEIKSKTGFNLRFAPQVDDTKNAAVPKIVISKQWTPKINTSASRTLGNTVTQDVRVEYELNKNVYLIGNWEGKQLEESPDASAKQRNTTQDIFGLDLQYKQEFK